jgi:hypothetical protein
MGTPLSNEEFKNLQIRLNVNFVDFTNTNTKTFIICRTCHSIHIQSSKGFSERITKCCENGKKCSTPPLKGYGFTNTLEVYNLNTLKICKVSTKTGNIIETNKIIDINKISEDSINMNNMNNIITQLEEFTIGTNELPKEALIRYLNDKNHKGYKYELNDNQIISDNLKASDDYFIKCKVGDHIFKTCNTRFIKQEKGCPTCNGKFKKTIGNVKKEIETRYPDTLFTIVNNPDGTNTQYERGTSKLTIYCKVCDITLEKNLDTIIKSSQKGNPLHSKGHPLPFACTGKVTDYIILKQMGYK